MSAYLTATDFLASLGGSAQDVTSALDAASGDLRAALLSRGVVAPAALEGFPGEFRELVRRNLEGLALGYQLLHAFRSLAEDDPRLPVLRDQVKAARRWLKGLETDGNPLGLLTVPASGAASPSGVEELDVELPGEWAPLERF